MSSTNKIKHLRLISFRCDVSKNGVIRCVWQMSWVISVIPLSTALIKQTYQRGCISFFQNLFIKLAGCSKCLETRFNFIVGRLTVGFSALAVYGSRRTDHCEHRTRSSGTGVSRSSGLFLVQTTEVQNAKAERDYRKFLRRNYGVACLNCESNVLKYCLQTLLCYQCCVYCKSN